ncbi:MAG: type II toxin-antitoxin system VapC family toxin [Algoriphagus aquaeductus]|uniref:type II toxin-antitoxin system VapC family toxin n=1 Tax=Algoriphagus aquaeductus TaxID=475299 RepID=UPI0038798340
MEGNPILLDTGILIEYFRNKEKSKSVLYRLSLNRFEFKVSSITKYEVLLGATGEQMDFWKEFFDRVQVLPFTADTAVVASEVYKALKSKNKLIDIADILIASVALTNAIPLATLNFKHFSRIEALDVLDL